MPSSNSQPETLTLDRLPTPIGVALLVTDEAGALRAFNWTDYEAAMRAWIGRHYPKAQVVEGRVPPSVRGAFEAYFRGDARALESVPWKASGTPFQLQVWEALCSIPAGETTELRRFAWRRVSAARPRCAPCGPCQRRPIRWPWSCLATG